MSGLTLVAAAALAAAVRGHEIEQSVVQRRPRGDDAERVTRHMKVYLAGDKARLEHEDGTVTIVRLDTGVMYLVDDPLECYEKRSFKALRKARKARDKLALEEIEGTPLGHHSRAERVDRLTDGPRKWEEIWKLPEGEARSRLVAKYRLPDEPPLEIEVRRIEGEEGIEKVAGVECRRYESLENGRATDRARIAEDMPFDRRYYEFMELTGWIGPELADGLRKAKGVKRGKGVPLETTMHFRTGGSVEIRTKSVTPADEPAGKELDIKLFEVPEGYTERKSKSTFR